VPIGTKRARLRLASLQIFAKRLRQSRVVALVL
jgi:hypothetical protein